MDHAQRSRPPSPSRVLLTCALTVLVAGVAAPAQTGFHEVLQFDPVTGGYASLGCVQAFTTPLTAAAWYGYDNDKANPASGVSLSDDTAQVLLLSASDGLHLVYLLDGLGDGTGGAAEVAWSITGAPVDWVVSDDGWNEPFTGGLGSGVYTAQHGWGSAYADGGVLGALGGSWTATGVFTDLDGSPDDDLVGIATVVVRSADGNDVLLVAARDRPLRLRDTCSPRFRVSQWNPSTARFDVLGCVASFSTSQSASGWYGYDGNDHNIAPGGPSTTTDEATLFLLGSAVDGLCLGYLLDDSGDGSGGSAELSVSTVAGSLGGWLVLDDASGDGQTASNGTFTASHTWSSSLSDGGVLGALAGSWVVDVAFTDVNGVPGDETTGLATWTFASGSGGGLPLVLAPDLPVRIDTVCGAGCVTPPGMEAWWPFDEASPATTARETANRHDADHQNLLGGSGTPTPAVGHMAGALSFDEVGELAVAPDDDGLDLGTDDVTIDAWVRLDDLPSSVGAADHALLTKGTIDPLLPQEHAYTLHLTPVGADSHELLLHMRADGVQVVAVSTGAGVPIGAWTHVAVTVRRATGEIRFYVDGTPVPATVSGTVPVTDMDSAKDAWIGFDAWGQGPASPIVHQLVGAVDELELLHRVLAPGEIWSIAELRKCKESGEVPWMRTACPTDTSTTTKVTICNDNPVPAAYRWSLVGLPAGTALGCDADGPDTFDLPGGGPFETVTLSPGACTTVTVVMHHDPLPDGSVAAYELLVENVASGHVFGCTGLVQGSDAVVKFTPSGEDAVTMDPDAVGVVVDVPVVDVGGTGAVVAWSALVGLPDPDVDDDPDPNDPGGDGDPSEVPPMVPPPGWNPALGAVTPKPGVSGAGGPGGRPAPAAPHGPVGDPFALVDLVVPETMVFGLDGLAPGQVATGRVVVPAAGAAAISVQVDAAAHVPFQVHELLLLADLDGDGAQEVVASVPLRTEVP